MKQILKLAAIALAMSTALPSAPSNAAEAADFTPAQQARIGEIAADYLVAHPDVLIEVSKKLQARQQAMQQQAYVQSALKAHRLLMQLDGVPVKGPADSKVIVTEFFDYECIACSMMAPVMEKVMAANAGVRFAFRDWTIFAARYPESTLASHRGLGIYRRQGAEAYNRPCNRLRRAHGASWHLSRPERFLAPPCRSRGIQRPGCALLARPAISGRSVICRKLNSHTKSWLRFTP